MRDLVRTTDNSASIVDEHGFLAGPEWQRMNDEDLGIATQCEIALHCPVSRRQLLPGMDSVGLIIIRIAGRTFIVGRHTNGELHVMGISDHTSLVRGDLQSATVRVEQGDSRME